MAKLPSGFGGGAAAAIYQRDNARQKCAERSTSGVRKMNRPLRILQVSAADVRGGAESVALPLHRGYRRMGHEAWLLVGDQRGQPEPGIIRIDNESARNPWAKWWRGLGRRFPAIPKAGRLKTVCELLAEPKRQLRLRNGYEDFDHPGSQRLFDHVPSLPDVVHLH